MAPSRGRESASELDLQPVLEIRYRRKEKWMEDMRDELRHEHDTALQEWLEEARKNERPKRPNKKRRKAKKSKRSAKGQYDVWQTFSHAQLEQRERLRWEEQEERIANQAYCRIMGVAYERVKKNQVAKLVELRTQYGEYKELRVEMLERELFPLYQDRLEHKIRFRVSAGYIRDALEIRRKNSKYTNKQMDESLARLQKEWNTYVGNPELKKLVQQGVQMACRMQGVLREKWIMKAWRRLKILRRKREEFNKTRRFVGNRIRMCRMKRLGRQQRYKNAKAEIVGITARLNEKWLDNEEIFKKREKRSQKEKRKRRIAWEKKRRSEEKNNWDADKANQERKQYHERKSQDIIKILRVKVRKQEIRETIETSMENETYYAKKVRQWRKKKKQWVKCWKEGRRKIVMRNDGLVWMSPQEVPGEITWRREQRRRKLLARWESPPPGPPGT